MNKNAFRNRILSMMGILAFLSLLVAALGVPFPRQAAGAGPGDDQQRARSQSARPLVTETGGCPLLRVQSIVERDFEGVGRHGPIIAKPCMGIQ